VIRECRRLPADQRAPDCRAVTRTRDCPEPDYPAAHLPPRELLRAVRHGQCRRRRDSAVPLQRERLREPGARPARAGPLVAHQRAAGDADHRDLRHSEAARVLHPAVPRGTSSGAEGAVRIGVDRRGRSHPELLLRHRAGRALGNRARAARVDGDRGQPVHRAVPADRGRRAQRGLRV
ncbi:hypothetical protein OY671_010467, partial [Metschnikowia pulcherrima]